MYHLMYRFILIVIDRGFDCAVEAPVPKQESPSKSRNRRRRRRTSSGKLKPSTDNSDLAQPQADQSNRAQAQAASPKKSPAKRRRAAAKSRLGATSESNAAVASSSSISSPVKGAVQEDAVPAGTRVSKRAIAQRHENAEPKGKKRRVAQASVTTDEDVERVNPDEDAADVENPPAPVTKSPSAKKNKRNKKATDKKVSASTERGADLDKVASPLPEPDSTKKKAARTTRKKAVALAELESVVVASPRRSRRTRI